MSEFRTSDVERIIGLKRNRLQAWIDSGFVAPSEKATGSGTRNLWSRIDLYTLAIFKNLSESGLSRKLAADFIGQGILSPEMSEDELEKIDFILYMRKNAKAGALYITGAEVDFNYQAETLGLIGFDDCYLFNFQAIKTQVDEAIKRRGCGSY